MPVYAGQFKAGDIRHLDISRKKSFTRMQARVRSSLISNKPISIYDTAIEIKASVEGLTDENDYTKLSMSLEDALDLQLCIGFNPMCPSSRERLNPFAQHFKQMHEQVKLGMYL